MFAEESEITLLQFALACPACGSALEIAKEKEFNSEPGSSYRVLQIRDVITDYLSGREECCPNEKCRRKLDWWKILRSKLRSGDSRHLGFLLTGGQISEFKFLLRPSESIALRFSDYGIPSDAQRMTLQYFPCLVYPMPRFVYPLEDWSAGMQGRLIRGEIPERVSIRAVPIEADGLEHETPEPFRWIARVAWIPPHISSGAHASIARAFFSLIEGRLRDVPVEAQVAVEGTLRGVLDSVLSKHISRDKVNDLLVKALTFNQQLNALYPFFLGTRQLPPLPDEIRGAVNTLANARNKIVHTLEEHPLTAETVADGVLASLFTLRHLSLIETMLNSQQETA